MSVLDELGLRETDLGGLMADYVQRPRRGGGRSAAVTESIRASVARGTSVEQAARNHGVSRADLRPERAPTCFEVGLNDPLFESEDELDSMLAELGDGRAGAPAHAEHGLTEPLREDLIEELDEVLSEGAW